MKMMQRKTISKNELARLKRERLVALHESFREAFRELSGLTEKKLWGGLAYRYEDQMFFTLTLRPRTVLIAMKLPEPEAELALGLSYVHPHGFTRLARNGWIAVSVTPDVPLDRVNELLQRSYWSRIEMAPRRRRRRFENLRQP